MQTMQAMDVRAAREELMRAVHDMSQRCLHQGGKWAAEQLVALERTGASMGAFSGWIALDASVVLLLHR